LTRSKIFPPNGARQFRLASRKLLSEKS
jgi:hypothetical protein